MGKAKHEKKLPKQISFKYVIPDPCPQLYVNGALGGLTHRLEIQLSFYFERPAIPNSVKHKIEENGKLGREISRDQEHQMIRLIQSSIVMDLPTAKAIVKLLNEKIDTLEKLTEGKEQ